jgi:hypothetical protein
VDILARTTRLHPAITTCLALASLLATACDQPGWILAPDVRSSDVDVAVALGDTAVQSTHTLAAEDIPVLAYPKSLRPCCAFGANLKVAVGRIPVPGVELANLVDLDTIGPHRYDNGYLSIRANDPRGFVDSESNGLVYTCRGGFVDTAHVRDNADNTVALAFAMARMLETGGSFTVPPQGAVMTIHLRPISPEAIARLGRPQIAIALAQ